MSNPFRQWNIIRYFAILVIILVGLMVFWQCQPSKQSDDQLVIISPHPDGIKEVFGSSLRRGMRNRQVKQWKSIGGMLAEHLPIIS